MKRDLQSSRLETCFAHNLTIDRNFSTDRGVRRDYTMYNIHLYKSKECTHEVWSIVLFCGSSHLKLVMYSGWSTSGWQFNINDEPMGLVCFGCVGLMISDGSLAAESVNGKKKKTLSTSYVENRSNRKFINYYSRTLQKRDKRVSLRRTIDSPRADVFSQRWPFRRAANGIFSFP